MRKKGAVAIFFALLVALAFGRAPVRAATESGSMTIGTATLNFGSAPNGPAQASVAVTGLPAIKSTSHLDVRVSLGTATAEHSTDEHLVETIRVCGGTIVAGTGFTIYGECMTGSTYGNFTVEWEVF